MDDGKLYDQLARGNRAAQLLNDEAFAGAFEAVAEELKRRWLNSAPPQAAEREAIWQQLYQLGQVKQALLIAVANAGQAQRALEEFAAGEPAGRAPA